MPETFLYRLHMQKVQASVSKHCLIHKVCRDTEKCGHSAYTFHQKGTAWQMHGNNLCGHHPIEGVPQQRIHIHKVFKGIAARGKCSMGWFYGFKLHLICNEKGEILNFMFTPGDVDDRKPFENFVVNMLGAIAAYCFFPKKPCIHVYREVDNRLTLF